MAKHIMECHGLWYYMLSNIMHVSAFRFALQSCKATGSEVACMILSWALISVYLHTCSGGVQLFNCMHAHGHRCCWAC